MSGSAQRGGKIKGEENSLWQNLLPLWWMISSFEGFLVGMCSTADDATNKRTVAVAAQDGEQEQIRSRQST